MADQEKVWFTHIAGVQSGPLTLAELRVHLGNCPSPNEVVLWKPGMKGWEKIANIPGLKAQLAAAPERAAAPAPAPAPPPFAAANESTLSGQEKDLSVFIEMRKDPPKHVVENTGSMDLAMAQSEHSNKISPKILIAAVAVIVVLAAAFFTLRGAHADDYPPAKQPPDVRNDEERIDVKSLKEKYWAKGEETELRVVQNRAYTRSGKLELGLFLGTVSGDPFLDIKAYGGEVGYHFSESIGVNLLYWKYGASTSSSLATLQAQTGVTANTNEPRSYFGGEFTYSPIYGKLSLLGKAIIHYDLFLIGGLGRISTETGSSMTPTLGVGQQIYLTKALALRLDYRWQRFSEQARDKANGTGNLLAATTTTNGVVTVGLTYLFSLFR
jgi:outer membrane beta-barrel protein